MLLVRFRVWCIYEINGRWLLMLGVAREKSLAGRFEYSNYSILKSTTLLLRRYESLFLFGLFMMFSWIINKFINSVVKVFLACIFRIYSFYQFIINLAQISAFMLFTKMINKSKNTVVKKGRIKICNGSCCHSNCFKVISAECLRLRNL